jgi:hypothetical protein
MGRERTKKTKTKRAKEPSPSIDSVRQAFDLANPTPERNLMHLPYL